MVDFGKTAIEYRKYRSGFPPEFFWSVRNHGIGLEGQHILDLGTGTGTLARNFAKAGARVIGIDISERLLEQSRAIDAEENVSVEYKVSPAEKIDLPSESFDVISAGQCWHWFDGPRAAAETYRLLKPGGQIVIAHFDWLPLPGSAVEATETLILKFNPNWEFDGGTGLYPRWLKDLGSAGLEDLRTFSFDLSIPFSHETWRGRIRASAGVAASLKEDKVREFDLEHQTILSKNFPQNPLSIPHRVWALLGRKIAKSSSVL